MLTFLVRHMLICPNGGLVITCHNEIHDEILYSPKKSFYPNCLCGKTLINLGNRISEEEVHHGGSVQETRGDVSIWCLQESQT